MKCILIDPVKQKIGRTEMDPHDDYKNARRVIRCSIYEVTDLPNDLMLWWNFYGMMDVSEKPLVAKKGFFVILDHKGAPLQLYLGRALIGKIDKNSNLIPLPDIATPEYVARYVRFILPANNIAAAKLGAEIVNCDRKSHKPDYAIRQRNFMQRALALCQN